MLLALESCHWSKLRQIRAVVTCAPGKAKCCITLKLTDMCQVFKTLLLHPQKSFATHLAIPAAALTNHVQDCEMPVSLSA